MCNDKNECPLGRLITREGDAMLSHDGIDTNASEEEFLGLLIANHFQWDGVRILEMAAVALEDANYHGECAVVLGLIRTAKQTRRQRGN